MHLTPHEQARLLVATAADLARRRLARGARLGATEAGALITDEVQEWAWDGLPLSEVVRRAGSVLRADQVLPGVPAKLHHLQIDALFPSGTLLVDVIDPVGQPGEKLAGSGESTVTADRPEMIELNAGRPKREVTVTNRADRTVRVTSHVDFASVNPLLDHDRTTTSGWRPDIPAGSSISFQPGETRTVTLVAMAATRKRA
ncbi:urease subunit gamma/beta [Modestobacter sp. DSM 44400]|uniref:urease subunit gamma n=1 Tax=Modestobacter sp. DSM 44400 TaxID=1550230 RepID=UPI00089AAA82|nr:urease subunit gamma [Modestobacter sp. DSM 44400]SDY84343.1 urease subunit gamma/beta [Modestobacter sp. DSM 44400]